MMPLLTALENLGATIVESTGGKCPFTIRGQITGGLLDGPLAFDSAISKEAAKVKNIRSAVAGDPGQQHEVVVPAGDLEGVELQ